MVVIMWKGKGWMVPAVAFGISFCAEILTRLITQNDDYYGESPWILPLAMLVSGGILYAIVQRLKGDHVLPLSPILDAAESARPAYRKQDHSFFLVPMEYWVISLIVFAILVFVQRSL